MAIAELEYFASNGLGLGNEEARKLLPVFDVEKAQRITVETEERIRTAMHAHGVKQTLQVRDKLLDAGVKRIAAFHALAHDLGIYAGISIGHFVAPDKQDRGFFLLVAEEGLLEQGIDDMLEVAIAGKHSGIEGKHRADIEQRRLFNLTHGLSQSMFETDLTIHTHPLSTVIWNDPDFSDRQTLLNKLEHGFVKHFVELIPKHKGR